MHPAVLRGGILHTVVIIRPTIQGSFKRTQDLQKKNYNSHLNALNSLESQEFVGHGIPVLTVFAADCMGNTTYPKFVPKAKYSYRVIYVQNNTLPNISNIPSVLSASCVRNVSNP